MTNQLSAANPTFRVLGALSVYTGGEYVALPACKPGSMLAGLLVSPNEVTSNEFLARVVWGDDTEVDTRAALRTCTTRLRKLLLRHNLADDLITTVPGGFRVKASAVDLDLLQFRELVARSAHQPTAEGQLNLLRAALELWDGPVLCNVESDVLHRGVVPLLEEERLQALERVVDVLRAEGREQDALAELQQLTRTYEGHERFALRLAETLYAVGRREDALAECRRIKGYLDEELGLEATPELRDVEVSILRGEVPRPVPVPDDRVADHATQGSGPQPVESVTDRSADGSGNGPDTAAATNELDGRRVRRISAQSGFIGRDDSLAALTSLLTSNPHAPALVVITGAPGIGKTALATAVAGQVASVFPRSGMFALHAGGGVRPPGEVVDEVRREVGEQLRRTLLILDDAGDEQQVVEILAGLTGAAIIVTGSSDLLGLVRTHGAFVHRVRPMTDAEAFSLLRSMIGDDRLVGDLPSAHELVRSGWGNPLVLRMIAAQMQVRPGWSAQQCVHWLNEDPVWRLSVVGGSMSLMNVYRQASSRLGADLGDTVRKLSRLPGAQSPSPFSRTQARTVLNGSTDSALPRLVAMGWLDEIAPDTFDFDRMLHHCLTAKPRPDEPDVEVPNLFALRSNQPTKEGA